MTPRKTNLVIFPKHWLVAIASTCAGVVACGGGLAGVRTDCPAGQTTLDGTCVSQPIADYVGCIRAMGATVASNSAKELSAKAGMAGVTAATQADVQDKLEKSYAKMSDANSLEIIHDCRNKTSAAAEAAASPQAPDPAGAAPVAANGAPAAASAPAATPAAGDVAGAAAFVGNWTCVTTVNVSNAQGNFPVHVTVPLTVVDNGDGTITAEVPNDKNNATCPPRPWPVRGSTARPNLPAPWCTNNKGELQRTAAGEMEVAGRSLTVKHTVEVQSDNPGKAVIVAHCTR